MRTIPKSLRAFWPALIGVLASHDIAYAGHDDGHIHGYLETVGPALVVAAIVGWIWSWAHSAVDFRSVLVMQAALFAVMEVSERAAGTITFQPADLAPLLLGLAILPLAAVASILADRVDDLFLGTSVSVSSTIAHRSGLLVSGDPKRAARSSISAARAPPLLS